MKIQEKDFLFRNIQFRITSKDSDDSEHNFWTFKKTIEGIK